MTPPGQHDYSGVRLTHHALERFVERFGGAQDEAAESLRTALRRTRRLGRNPANGAVAVLALHGGGSLVAILQESACLTVLTWNQFLPHLSEFGRPKLPRKWGRVLRRLGTPLPEAGPDESAGVPELPFEDHSEFSRHAPES